LLLVLLAILCTTLAGCGAAEDPDEKKATVTPSGLKYLDLKVGEGEKARASTIASVRYVGKLRDGSVFDSNKEPQSPFRFVIGLGQVIKGWDEGVEGMKEGGKRKLFVPAALAYGDKSPSAKIPANSDLVFEIELLEVKKGIEREDLKVGDGAKAEWGKTVEVHYVGQLDNGNIFDRNPRKEGDEPFSFSVGAGQVIPGWDYGVLGMRVGGKRKLVLQPELAYGAKGAGKDIPPNAVLTFEIELLKVN
jgi:peptidylprolyl isomerase